MAFLSSSIIFLILLLLLLHYFYCSCMLHVLQGLHVLFVLEVFFETHIPHNDLLCLKTSDLLDAANPLVLDHNFNHNLFGMVHIGWTSKPELNIP